MNVQSQPQATSACAPAWSDELAQQIQQAKTEREVLAQEEAKREQAERKRAEQLARIRRVQNLD